MPYSYSTKQSGDHQTRQSLSLKRDYICWLPAGLGVLPFRRHTGAPDPNQTLKIYSHRISRQWKSKPSLYANHLRFSVGQRVDPPVFLLKTANRHGVTPMPAPKTRLQSDALHILSACCDRFAEQNIALGETTERLLGRSAQLSVSPVHGKYSYDALII